VRQTLVMSYKFCEDSVCKLVRGISDVSSTVLRELGQWATGLAIRMGMLRIRVSQLLDPLMQLAQQTLVGSYTFVRHVLCAFVRGIYRVSCTVLQALRQWATAVALQLDLCRQTLCKAIIVAYVFVQDKVLAVMVPICAWIQDFFCIFWRRMAQHLSNFCAWVTQVALAAAERSAEILQRIHRVMVPICAWTQDSICIVWQRIAQQFNAWVMDRCLPLLSSGLCACVHGVLDIHITIVRAALYASATLCITVHNIVYRPRCSVCERGCAKLRSLCFTCVGDHLVPRCSDCGVGWCKAQSRCFSCLVDHHLENPRCDTCQRGFKKIGRHCVTCFADQFLNRCAVCHGGYQKLGSLCFTCFADRFWHRCGVCRRGYCKIGNRCLTCFSADPPRCSVCCRGYQKIGSFCFTCYLDRFYERCAVCQRGYKKIGPLCLTCQLDRFHSRCGVCHRGYAKIGSRCFTCFRQHLMDFPRCGVCHRGYAKIGSRCFTCFKQHLPRCAVCHRGSAKLGTRCFTCFRQHMTNYPRCGVCQRGYAKVGTRCFTCFKVHISQSLRNPPRCGICQRGYAKIGLRCFTCYRKLASQSGRKVVDSRVPDAKSLLRSSCTTNLH